MFCNQLSNNNNHNTLLLQLILLVSCMMMGFTAVLFVESTTSCGCCCSTLTSTNSSIVQSYWEVIDREIIELTCHQNRFSNALSLLKINSTLNAEILSIRSKQMEKITKTISLLTQESTFLKSVTLNISIISRNGQPFEYSDGTRANSCREYRNNPIQRYQYNNEGSGLYNIEPSNRLILTVYCDMTTDGGGWTLISGIRYDYAGVHFHTFEDSTAIASSSVNSFHVKTSTLLSLSTQVRAAHDIAANPMTTFYQSSWSYSAYCTITQALRDAIQITPTINNLDLPTSCAVLTGSFSTIPTHFTYGRTIDGHSTGFRMGIPLPAHPGHFTGEKSYGTYTFSGALEGGTGPSVLGLYHTFGTGVYTRNGAVFLR